LENNILLEVKNLHKYFPVERSPSGVFKSTRGHFIKAVDNLSLFIHKGETLGLVGESGCGKSTLARLILRLIEPDAGEVYFEGKNLLKMDKKELRAVRGKMQIIFQNPYASLNPRLTVDSMLSEILQIHGFSRRHARERISMLLHLVGLNESDLNKYPHEFSGGQRQRIGIARALAINPSFIVADEPVSSLDVSIQAQIINLLVELQKNLSLTYLFIAHDLSVVRYISDRIAVMYRGKIMEESPASELYDKPLHPYTKLLLSSVLEPGEVVVEKTTKVDLNLAEQNIEPVSGCRFYFRCYESTSDCKKIEPDLKEVSNGHLVRCIKYN